MNRRLIRLALAALLMAATGTAAAVPAEPEPFGSLLREADAIRSTDPGRFAELLGELNAVVGEASPSQREHLRYLKAYQLAYTGRYDLAIAEAKALLEQSTQTTLRFRAGLLAANSAAATREFAAGLGYLDQSLALIDQIQDPAMRDDGLTVAALIYNQVGQYALGRDFADQVLERAPSPRARCYAGHLQVEARYHLGELPEDEAPVQAVVDGCIAAGEVIAANLARGYLARLRAGQGRLVQAIALLDDHLAEAESTRYPHLIGEFRSLLAQYRLANGDDDAAVGHAQAALVQAAGIPYSLPRVDAEKTLYEAALRRGDTAGALEHLRRYAEADKAYLDDVKAREIAFQAARHDTLNKSQTIALLNQRNQVLQLEQEVARKAAQANRLLVLLLAVLAASIGYWAYKIKRLQLDFRRLAETDALTGVSNRHDFTRRAEQALEYCRRSGQEVCLVMMDLDKFKDINDQFGHAAGDWVLKQVALACQGICRSNDRVGRLGGEEFAFLLVGCELDSAVQLARQCGARIAAIDTAPTGHRFRITGSFGVASTRNTGHDFAALLARADAAMYRSKREGRDRVSVHRSAGDGDAVLVTA